MADELRYMPNDQPLQALSKTPQEFFQIALEEFVDKTKVPTTFEQEQPVGIFAGFTGIPYMFLQLSELHPDVQVNGENPRQLAERYITIGADALTACLSGEENDVERFVASTISAASPSLRADQQLANEILYGRAGVVFLLRLVRHWVPRSTARLDAQMKAIAARIMEANNHGQGSWAWANRRLIGAVHGAIGIITQLVLCLPGLASKLEPHLLRLLALQFNDGNWPKFMGEGETESDVVQFCHGTPGFVISLQALRPYYPHLSVALDEAIAKGIELIWVKGLLRKEPALCHGVSGKCTVSTFSNEGRDQKLLTLARRALPRGGRHEHFLSLVESQSVEELEQKDSKMFGRAITV
ncbi:LanC-like protein 2 [Beauveria bassiana D1-5]|uniref:LanC-like protein 2 n=1 Tax=Beauveria bassiana D1-5 TaxID=1245745 RepID=A0A0A2VQM8_BEABA|nr:LanC-like protein 2 [Beauveria bassiana D1-5]